MYSTIAFLNQLSMNNNRDWFQEHKSEYQVSYNEMIHFAEGLLAEMSTHDVIETASGKKSLFRIYRDVRFSKDKSPYKTNWAGRFQRAGANRRGGYYYQIGSSHSYVMGGFFGPNAQDLLHIRKQIVNHSDQLRAILQSTPFKKSFGKLEGEQLKTAPKGFEKDHPDIDLLRHKQFILRHNFTKDEMMEADFHIIMSNTFQKMRPFFDVMTEILTTDLNGHSLL